MELVYTTIYEVKSAVVENAVMAIGVIQHTESVPTGGGNEGTARAQQHEYIENNEQRDWEKRRHP